SIRWNDKVIKSFYIEKSSNIQIMPDVDANLGDPQVFTIWFTDILKRYPSKHICLVFADGGIFKSYEKQIALGKFKAGICFGSQYTTVAQVGRLAEALQSVSNVIQSKIDIIGF